MIEELGLERGDPDWKRERVQRRGEAIDRGSVSEISPLSQLLQHLNTTAGQTVKWQWIIMPTPRPHQLTPTGNQSTSYAAVRDQSPAAFPSELLVCVCVCVCVCACVCVCVRMWANSYASTCIFSALSCFPPWSFCKISEYRTVHSVPDSFPF